MILIDGKKVAAEIRSEIKKEVDLFRSQGKKIPHLGAILVGHDGGSETYIANKEKACNEVGFISSIIRYEDHITEQELLIKINELNNDKEIDGFIVQLPLPANISEQKVIESIAPEKDVDGFHPVNIGRMVLGLPAYYSATPNGIMELLKWYNITTSGKHCVVLGRSHITGRPVSILMSMKTFPGNATVTVCHSQSENLKEICRNADILIAAIGKPEFVTADMIKDGAVVIDVGTTRVKSNETTSGFKLKGDVDFKNVSSKCSFITPVPGGVGPMTIVSLLKNTLKAAKRI